MITAGQVMINHADAKIDQTEGGSCEKQISYFLEFLRKYPEVKTVLEIGFNGGLSASAFLSAREDIQVISVDIGRYAYVLTAKHWIDKTFPGRHTLLIGDSTSVMPNVLQHFSDFRPDLIFIDGGHDAPVPEKDLKNCLQIARPDTWLILDDVVPWMVGILTPLNILVKSHKIHVIEQATAGEIHGWILFKKVG